MMGQTKTVLFEKMYDTDISKFSTTSEVNDFLVEKLKKPLKTVSLPQNIVSKRGSVFPIKSLDIDGMFDNSLRTKRFKK